MNPNGMRPSKGKRWRPLWGQTPRYLISTKDHNPYDGMRYIAHDHLTLVTKLYEHGDINVNTHTPENIREQVWNYSRGYWQSCRYLNIHLYYVYIMNKTGIQGCL